MTSDWIEQLPLTVRMVLSAEDIINVTRFIVNEVEDAKEAAWERGYLAGQKHLMTFGKQHS